MPLLRSAGLRIALFAAVLLGLYACHDITAPRTLERSPRQTVLANPPGVVSITPDSMRGWAFYDDQQGAICSDPAKCRMMAGEGERAFAGGGSAELVISAAAEGNALILQDYAGARFDHITDLSYSTQRQSEDAGRNLAIALQFNADYDLTDQSLQYQGRLVFEPYHGAGGNVPDTTWQRWDAKAGKWWGTQATVRRSDVTMTNPCVQATPCTWGQLLDVFPNVGVHPTYGAVILKAGSGWPSFRGNVDSLTIAIDSIATTFDFEPSGAQSMRLVVEVHPGVVGSWPIDSTYPPGAILGYDVVAGPGRDVPIVILDDTLASNVGHIVMNGEHRLEVVSDTIYSYEQLTPLEKSLADLNRQLLTAADRPAVMQAIIDFGLSERRAGTSAEALLRAAALAEYIVVDPIRDSTALRNTDEALAGWDFYTEYDESGVYYTYHLKEGGLSAASSASRAARSRQGKSGPLIAADTGKTMSVSSPRLPVGSGRLNNMISVTDPDEPQEFTQIIYTNGISTDEVAAGLSKSILADLVFSQRRFGEYYTNVMLRYNPTWTTQMADYDPSIRV